MEYGERDVKGALGGKTLWEQSMGLLRIHWVTIPVRARKGSIGIGSPSQQDMGGRNRKKKQEQRKNMDFYTVTISKFLLSHR